MMKLYSPKDLADRSPYSVDYIRRNAEAFGFVRLNENSRKWVATEEMIERAVGKFPTNNPYRSIGTSSSSIVAKPLGGRLAREIDAMRKESAKKNGSSDQKLFNLE